MTTNSVTCYTCGDYAGGCPDCKTTPHTTEIGMDITVAMHIATALMVAQPNADRFHKQVNQAIDYIRDGFSFTLHGDVLTCYSRRSAMEYRTEGYTCTCPGYVYNGYCYHGALFVIVTMYDTMTRLIGTPEPAPAATAPTAPAYTYEAGPARTRMSDAEYADLCRRLDDECF